ncbi:MAG TPA: hypothetical protein VKU00_24435 [Chthonomonadaceae bacterium]|nr:hypothetical protein [Chthonomonadaceae bacterium]
MEDNTTPSGKRPRKLKEPFDKSHPYHPGYTGDNPRGVANGAVAIVPQAAPPPIPIVTKGQKYVAPSGRHSQQTHRRAEERATALGHTTEKELHAHDRGVVSAELNRQAEQKLKQQTNQQKARNAAQKVTAPEPEPENKQS